MTLSVWQEQAKEGDAEAIAALLNQSLTAHGITVRAERESYCLNLWLTGATLPPQPRLVDYLRRVIERLQIDSIGILHIEAEATTDPSQSWTTEMALLAGVAYTETNRSEDVGALDSRASEARASEARASEFRATDSRTTEPLVPEASGIGEASGIADPRALPPKVARAYQELNLTPDASLADIERSYFKTKAALLRQGKRADLEPLKWAFTTLKDYLDYPPQPDPPPPSPSLGDLAALEEWSPSLPAGATGQPIHDSGPDPTFVSHSSSHPLAEDPSPDPALALQTLLRNRGLPAQVALRADQLHIRWPAVRVTNPKQATAQIYALLLQQDWGDLGLGDDVTTLVVAALDSQNRAVWRQTLTLPQRPTVEEDTDLMSFNNRYSNGIIFPALLVLGMLLNAMPIFDLLLRGIKIWIHEFGHAVIAWLAGRQAIPLPIGWTNVNPERSVFVYLGVLILLGLLYWSGQKEGKRWPMVLAVSLAVVQFGMTWLMSPTTFDMLLAFGGIGGELYLSTLLMVSFFFPLPAYWRWDFYRYPVVIGAAFTFWGQFWLWKRIRIGKASIPFGMMWGDAEHGDMNILVNRHQWEPGQLIGTYNTIANLCFLALLGIYAYTLYRQHRHRLWLLWH